ncbi:MAG: DUF4239 domain-containing protein [Pseudomonadota bacterium]|nr:DUF4239 domain-containing protein [Pseudomonadota bacterium]
MTHLAIGGAAGALTFLFGYAGMWLQKLLPQDHMSAGAREMIVAVMSLIALFLALVLGTLVGSAYGFFALQKSNVEEMAAQAVQLDVALATFRANSAPVRQGVRAAVDQTYRAIWAEEPKPLAQSIVTLAADFTALNADIAKLEAKTPEETVALPVIQASLHAIEKTRLRIAMQMASPIAWPLIVVVVSWAMLLFAGYGVLAHLNSTAVIATLIGAFTVGSAVFIIVELNHPFTGVFRVPGSAMRQTLDALAR